jgi:hypothetical protein
MAEFLTIGCYNEGDIAGLQARTDREDDERQRLGFGFDFTVNLTRRNEC